MQRIKNEFYWIQKEFFSNKYIEAGGGILQNFPLFLDELLLVVVIIIIPRMTWDNCN